MGIYPTEVQSGSMLLAERGEPHNTSPDASDGKDHVPLRRSRSGLVLCDYKTLLEQLAHRLAVVEDVHRPAAAVVERLRRVDAHRLVHAWPAPAAPGSGRSFGYSPRALVVPMAWPIFRPPPAIRADMTGGQWSRPSASRR